MVWSFLISKLNIPIEQAQVYYRDFEAMTEKDRVSLLDDLVVLSKLHNEKKDE